MRRCQSITTWRAIIGVVALYGLLLQAFVASATPAVLGPAGVLCADHASDAPSPGKPVRNDHGCCTLVQPATTEPPPAAGPAVAPPRRAVPITWRPELSILRTGPPTHSESARGPPVA